ncbi:hypothetical protein Mal4_06370 [Maioricimonas rarisocia]|uniref:DUF1501 domain-containing protein n=1 Tax=Maioricimonas rarisocia TaxID=2528026 RepID=A0A517Z1J6_9PLAN|nr:DUF1501 domain-containing protein [Maioricimonas rarisocia]QDU36352.1 hypothetical protein Mal4_06370 [Maioricimonas rarisocia]
MLNAGRFRAQTCGGQTRRAFLTLGTSAAAGLGLAGTLQRASAAQPHRAKSVILLWLWGAPSHLDTFDPKPDAPAEYRGPFSPIATRTPGLQISELLPRLANCSDRYALIRSMVTFDGGHPGAGTWGLTGFAENPEPVHPNFGSIVAKQTLQQRGPTELPPFFYVGRGIPRDLPRRIKGYGGGRLGQRYDPFLVNCQADGSVELPALDLLDDLSPARIDSREELLGILDDSRRRLDAAGFETWDRTWQTAYGLLTRPEARAAFDLTHESDTVRDAYGYTSFGQSCLLARRLVEAEVPYVQVNWSEYVEAMSPGCDFGWDTHIYNFELLQDRHCPILDRALSSLLLDLENRGLLDSTLVVAMGEFGRTPKLNKRAARDHWPRCYFSLWAGAGVAGGRVIGESDKLAQDPVTSPITPLMAGTTICELAGLDVATRSGMDVLEEGRIIYELF